MSEMEPKQQELYNFSGTLTHIIADFGTQNPTSTVMRLNPTENTNAKLAKQCTGEDGKISATIHSQNRVSISPDVFNSMLQGTSNYRLIIDS